MSDFILLSHPLNETTNNIIQVSKKIRKNIPDYLNYYNIILNYKYYSEKQIILTQPKLQSVEFIHYFKEPQHKSLINIIDTYQYLLKSLKLLHQQNILYNGFFLFFNSSILFTKPNHIPILNDFTYAMDCNLVSICSTFLETIDLSSTPMPPELYILSYLQQHNIRSLSQHDIEQMTHITGIDFLINKPYEYLITQLTRNQFKWDVYGLTIIFLHLIHHHIQYEHKYFDLFIKQLEQIIELGGVYTEDAEKMIQSILLL